jgi:hypothetical protein
MYFYPACVGTYVQRGSNIGFVVVLLVGVTDIAQNTALLSNYTMLSAYCTIACTFAGSLARQPCPAALPGRLAQQPCPAALPGSLARQPCPAALPGSLCPSALPGSPNILISGRRLAEAEGPAGSLWHVFPAINKILRF